MKKFISIIVLVNAIFMIKAQTGNVGINTDSPTHTLDVNGTLRVRNILQIGSNVAAKDSIMVFDTDGVVKYVSANLVLSQADAGITKVLTDATLKGDGSTGAILGLAQQAATIGQVLTWNGSTWIPQTSLSPTTTNSLSLSGNTLTSTVNTVSASSDVVSTVSNSVSGNSINTTVNGVTGSNVNIISSNILSLTSNNLSTSVNGVTSSNVDLTAYLDNTDSQNLSIVGNNLSISGGNTVTLPVSDGSETKLNAGTNISVTGSGTTASPYVINNTFTEVDDSITNEIQTLSLSSNTLSLSNGGGSVTLSGGTVTNVSGTAPISVANGTTTPTISLTRNNLNTTASSNTATSPLTVTNGNNAVVNGADTSLAVNNTAPLWNANKLQNIDISTTAPTNTQVLAYNSTTLRWEPYSGPALHVVANKTNAQTLTTTDAAFIFNVEAFDNILTYNPTTGVYTAPASGWYEVNASIALNFPQQTNPTAKLSLRKNNIIVFSSFQSDINDVSASAADKTLVLSTIVNLNAGDTLDFVISRSGAGTGTPTFINTAITNSMTIKKLN